MLLSQQKKIYSDARITEIDINNNTINQIIKIQLLLLFILSILYFWVGIYYVSFLFIIRFHITKCVKNENGATN